MTRPRFLTGMLVCLVTASFGSGLLFGVCASPAMGAPFFLKRPLNVQKKVKQAAEQDEDLKAEAQAQAAERARAKKNAAGSAAASAGKPAAEAELTDEALDLGPAKQAIAPKPDPQLEKAFDTVKEDRNKEIERHTKLGDMFFNRHDYTNSLIEFEIVLKSDAENFKAHYMLGKILMGMASILSNSFRASE